MRSEFHNDHDRSRLINVSRTTRNCTFDEAVFVIKILFYRQESTPVDISVVKRNRQTSELYICSYNILFPLVQAAVYLYC